MNELIYMRGRPLSRSLHNSRPEECYRRLDLVFVLDVSQSTYLRRVRIPKNHPVLQGIEDG